MVKADILERRSFARAKRVLSIEFRLVKSKRRNVDSMWHLSTTEDMSFGGLAFYTENEYRMGDTLEVRVVMSGVLDIYSGYGKIVRMERKKTGSYFLVAVKFLGMKVKNRNAKTFAAPRYIRKRSLKRV